MSQHHIWQQIPVYLSLPLLHFLLFVTSPFLPHKYRYTLSPKASFFCPLKDSDPLKALRCISVCCYGCVLRPLCLIWMATFVKVEEREWEIVKEKKWHGKIEKHIEDKSSALRSRDKNRTVIEICSLKEHGMRKILLGSFVVDKMLKPACLKIKVLYWHLWFHEESLILMESFIPQKALRSIKILFTLRNKKVFLVLRGAKKKVLLWHHCEKPL